MNTLLTLFEFFFLKEEKSRFLITLNISHQQTYCRFSFPTTPIHGELKYPQNSRIPKSKSSKFKNLVVVILDLIFVIPLIRTKPIHTIEGISLTPVLSH